MTLFLTLAADLIFLAVTAYFPTRCLRFSKKAKWVLPLCLTLFYGVTVFVRVVPYYNDSIIKTLLLFTLYFLMFFFAFENKASEKVLVFCFFTFSVFASDMLTYYTQWLIGIDYRANYGIFNGRIIGILTETVLMLVFSFVFEIIYNRIKKRRSNNLFYFVIILISQMFLIIAISYMLNRRADIYSVDFNNIQFIVLLFSSFFLTIFSDILLYRILVENFKNYELKEELSTVKHRNMLELEYYEKMKKSINETRKINHDIANVLSSVQILIDSGSESSKTTAQNTVNEMKELLLKNKVDNYCQNELVNLIIINKKSEIDRLGLDFSANLQIPEDIAVKNIDLCRIFTNLLDNAIEACADCDNKEECFIVISSKIKDNRLYIKCENYYDKPIERDKKGRLVSSKASHAHKGLGIEILKETAYEYSGSLNYVYEENIFSILIYLELKPQSK